MKNCFVLLCFFYQNDVMFNVECSGGHFYEIECLFNKCAWSLFPNRWFFFSSVNRDSVYWAYTFVIRMDKWIFGIGCLFFHSFWLFNSAEIGDYLQNHKTVIRNHVIKRWHRHFSNSFVPFRIRFERQMMK